MSNAISGQVMSEMNTTPLIDVLLVLLVMLIMTVPMATHKVSIDLPNGPPPTVTVDPVRNDLAITRDGAALWNGEPVDNRVLGALLAEAGSRVPAHEVNFRPDAEARYARVDEVLAMTKRAHVTKLAFVGNAAFARF